VAIMYRLGSVVMKSLCVLVPNAHMEIGKQIVTVILLLDYLHPSMDQ
jgi:hypothetical protein